MSQAVAPNTDKNTMMSTQAGFVRLRKSLGAVTATSIRQGTTKPTVTSPKSTPASNMPAA
jgi:hypothetical protein